MSLDLEEIEKIDKEWHEKTTNPLGIIEKDGKKYIDGEEILLELKLVPLDDIVVKTFLFICACIAMTPFFDTTEYDNPLRYIVLVIFIYALFMIINMYLNIYRNKLFITENHFITFRGVKIHKNDIYFMRVFNVVPLYGANQLKFYDNKSNVFDYFTGSFDDVEAFNKIMYKLSKNKYFYKDPITYTYTKRGMFDDNTKIKLMQEEN